MRAMFHNDGVSCSKGVPVFEIRRGLRNDLDMLVRNGEIGKALAAFHWATSPWC